MRKKGINGQQAALEAVNRLEAWVGSFRHKLTSDDDDQFNEAERDIAFFVNRRDGNLTKSKVAEAVGFPRSSWQSNDKLEPILFEFEETLREKEILPELTNNGRKEAKGESPSLRDTFSLKVSRAEKRASQLEIENMALQARVKELEDGLANLKELAEVLAELRIIKS